MPLKEEFRASGHGEASWYGKNSAGGSRSSTAMTGYGRCSRTGAQGTGRFGGVHQT